MSPTTSVAGLHMWHAFQLAFAGEDARPVTRRDGWLRFASGEMHPFGNFFIGDDPDAETVREAVSPLAATGFPAAAILPRGGGQGVEEALSELGFASAGTMPAMAVEIVSLSPCQLPAGYRFEEFGQDRGAEWTECLAEGYGLPYRVAEALSPVYIPPSESVRFFGAHKDGRIDAVSLVAICDGIAGIYSVATRPEARGRGLGAFVTAEPLRLVGEKGMTTGVLQASQAGYSVYKKLGFKDSGEVPQYLKS